MQEAARLFSERQPGDSISEWISELVLMQRQEAGFFQNVTLMFVCNAQIEQRGQR